MKKVLQWVVLIWSIVTIPYLFDADFATIFFSLLFVGLIIGLMIDGIRSK